MGGYTLWARKTLESEVFLWKSDKWFKIWFYIVNKVNWKDDTPMRPFPRGTGHMTYDNIKVATGATQDQVKHCIEYLKTSQMIATRKATRGMVVTVLKYEDYQDPGNYESHTESQLKATQKPHRSHTILKEGEEEKKEVVIYDFKNRKWQHISEEDIEQWSEAYPACDIKLELLKAGDWLQSNPANKKSNYRRFITNWLRRSQDRGGTKVGQGEGQTKGRKGVFDRWAEKQGEKE